MKILLFMLLPLSAFADWGSLAEIQSGTLKGVFTKKGRCEAVKQLCVPVPARYNNSYHVWKDGRVRVDVDKKSAYESALAQAAQNAKADKEAKELAILTKPWNELTIEEKRYLLKK